MSVHTFVDWGLFDTSILQLYMFLNMINIFVSV